MTTATEYRSIEYGLPQNLSYENLAELTERAAEDTGMRVKRMTAEETLYDTSKPLYFTLQRADDSPIALLWPFGAYGDNIESESQDVYSIYSSPAPETMLPRESRIKAAEEIQRYMKAVLDHCEAVRI